MKVMLKLGITVIYDQTTRVTVFVIEVEVVIIFFFIYLSGSMTAVAVFRKPNAIPPRFSIDFVLYFSLSWLRVLLPSMFF
jgi:hypothetical protein